MRKTSKNDRIRVQHMLEAAQYALAFIEGETRESFKTDTKLIFALVRAVEIVGEAATQVTPGFQEAYPDIPWKALKGMRNRLIHAYFAVNLDRLWDTVTVTIPELIAKLEVILMEEIENTEDTDSTLAE